MSTDLLARSSFTTTALDEASTYYVNVVAHQAAKVREITAVANEEIAKIGAHAIGTVATLELGANEVRRQLMDVGHFSPVYEDAHNKILQVTDQNIILMSNTGQKEVMRAALARMG